MQTDGYGEIINDPGTFKKIASFLENKEPVIIGWTDEDSTHYDILFTFRAKAYGMLQGGINGDYLFVSIMRKGAFGFDISEDTSYEYYGEKLFVATGSTLKELTKLINGVKSELRKII